MERHNSRNTRSLCNTVRDLSEQPEERNIADEFHNSLTGLAGQVQLDEALEEMAQTPERENVMRKKILKASRRLNAIMSLTRNGSRSHGIDADALHAEYGATYRRLGRLSDRNEREKGDNEKLYGDGGKVVAKRSKKWIPVKEEALDEASKRQLAKAKRNAKAKRVKRAAAEDPSSQETRNEVSTKAAADAAALYNRVTKGLSAGGYSYPKSMTENKTDDDYAGMNPKAREYDLDMVNPGAEEKKHKKSIEDAMKRLAAKALKRAREKAGRKAVSGIAEVAAPGTEDWASNPKVKKAFMERYGNDWKKVMYGRSWNMAKGLAESEQLLNRLKKAAYKADLASRSSVLDPTDARSQGKKHARLMTAAAILQAKVDASKARRGGASADAVRAGGSLIGKSGKYTQKAGALANQRVKGLANFRNSVVDRGVARDTGIGSIQAMANRLQAQDNFRRNAPKMSPEQVANKRESQAKMREFLANVSKGTFRTPEDPKAAAAEKRPHYNYLERTGKLKTKGK
jgi:hypothetical protein